MLVIFTSGIIRGAIAFGLVLGISSVPNYSVIKTTCLSLVLFTTILIGGLMGLIIKTLFELKEKSDKKKAFLD